MTDIITRPADTREDPRELRARINVALSLLDHRTPEPLAWSLVRLALLGARVDELAAIER